MATVSCLLQLALVALPSGLLAQDRSAMTIPIPRNVLEAEAEGATWARRTGGTTQRGDAAKGWQTDVPRKCMTAQASAPLRSGEFFIGGELNSGPRPSGQVKIWWEPKHPADSRPLVVRGVSLTNPADTLRQMMKELAIGMGSDGRATGPTFFPSGFWFPASGRFLVVATSGADWGCFILSH